MADPRVTWRIGVDDNVTRTLRGIDGRIASLGKSLRTLGGFAGFAAITAGIQRVAASAVELAGSLQDASERFGVSVEFLQRVGQVAEEAGSSLNAVQTALRVLARTTADAAAGSKEASAAFTALGLSADKLSKLNLEERFIAVSRALRGTPDAATRVALAQRLLGRSASELIPIMDDLEAKMRAVNNVASADQVRALDDAADAWTRFKNGAVRGTIGVLGEVILAWERLIELQAQQGGSLGQLGTMSLSQLRQAEEQLGRHTGPSRRRYPGQGDVRADPSSAIALLRQTTAELDRFLASNAVASRRATEAASDIAAIVERTRTPIEAYREGIRRTLELQKDYGLSAEDAAREIQRLGAVLGDETQAMVDATQAGKEWVALQEDIVRWNEAAITGYQKYEKEYLKLTKALESGDITQSVFDANKQAALDELIGKSETALVDLGDNTERLLEQIRNATDGVARDITAIFFDSTNSIADAFDQMFKRIAQSIIEQSVIQPLLDSLFGSLGSLFGGGPGLIDMSKLPKRRAIGGPVMANSPYIVGERGPELFVPQQTGRIVPNGQGVMPGITLNIQSLDPRTAASVIAQNEDVIVNVLRKAYRRAGKVAAV